VRPVPRWFRGGPGSRARQIVAGSIAAAAAMAASPQPLAQTAEAAQNEIRAALEKWQSSFNHRDEQQVCDIFARDVVANYDGEPERDYASLCEMLQTALQDQEKKYHYSLKINDIVVYGETAVARLVWMLEIDELGAPKEVVEEPAIDIFRRQVDGDWKISRYLAYPPAPR
jgi:ketosteroid isomerase-like protein